eukprot:1141218-Pelagomonas_calceolata.AAC.1
MCANPSLRLSGYLHLDLFQHAKCLPIWVENSHFDCGNCVLGGRGREDSPLNNLGKVDTLAQKSPGSPPPQSYKTESAYLALDGDLESYWKAPGPRTWL